MSKKKSGYKYTISLREEFESGLSDIDNSTMLRPIADVVRSNGDLGISKRHIRRLLLNEKIEGMKAGNTWFTSLIAVEKYRMGE